MATAPRWKVYRDNEYVASCKYPELAAVLVAAFGPGSTIRLSHRQIMWREGYEAFAARDSYEEVAILCEERRTHHVAWIDRSIYRQPRAPQTTR